MSKKILLTLYLVSLQRNVMERERTLEFDLGFMICFLSDFRQVTSFPGL